jgi:hypothetical protein
MALETTDACPLVLRSEPGRSLQGRHGSSSDGMLVVVVPEVYENGAGLGAAIQL